jgi:exodeoxyribonuclease-3
MLRIITANLNGIRSAANKGFFEWLARQNADFVCLQELKAHASDLSETMQAPKGYTGHFHFAEKKGYSGVAIYCRHPVGAVQAGMPSVEFDAEGRWVQVNLGRLTVVSVYLPSGSSSDERQQAKFRFLDELMPKLEQMRSDGQEYVICGDWNIAHKEIDLRNWRSNQKNSGFLPQERAWLTDLLDRVGWVDVFRTLEPGPDQYTWWSNRGQARAKNVGWRIDYQIATPGIAASARKTTIYTKEFFSDHAPLIIDYEWMHQV